jgi:hypothetical protein
MVTAQLGPEEVLTAPDPEKVAKLVAASKITESEDGGDAVRILCRSINLI